MPRTCSMGSRTGIRYGSAEMLDHMAWDGLTNPYDKQPMGVFGEHVLRTSTASPREHWMPSPPRSSRRAQAAQADGAFKAEIAPVTVKRPQGRRRSSTPTSSRARCDIGKIPDPASRRSRRTAPSPPPPRPSISDGAAATGADVRGRGRRRAALPPLARIVAHATHSQAPEWFTTAPVAAIQKVLEKAGWKVGDVDLFEVNEAFAVVAMAPIRELGIAHAKLNVNGGACALGHPIGASGARLIVTLIHALQRTRRQAGRRGAVHRRRRGHCDCHRTALKLAIFATSASWIRQTA